MALESRRDRLYKKILAVCKKQKTRAHLDSRGLIRIFAKMLARETVAEGVSPDGFQQYVAALMDSLEKMASAYDGTLLKDKTIAKEFSTELTRHVLEYYSKLSQEKADAVK